MIYDLEKRMIYDLEKRVVVALCKHLESKGFAIEAVHDGEEDIPVSDIKGAVKEIFAVAEAVLYVSKPGISRHGITLHPDHGIEVLADWEHRDGDPDGFNAAMEEFDAEQVP